MDMNPASPDDKQLGRTGKGKSYACRDAEENRAREGDYYPTPMSLVWCAVELFRSVIPAGSVVTEPCCGNGQLSHALREIGYKNIVENDLLSTRDGILHDDILAGDLSWSSRHVVTNFPFSRWDACVMAFLKKKDIDMLVTIGRLNYLSTQQRLDCGIWERLSEIWCFSRYVDYRTPERADGKFFVGAMATGWFVFGKGRCGPPVIRFVDVQDYATLGNLKK